MHETENSDKIKAKRIHFIYLMHKTKCLFLKIYMFKSLAFNSLQLYVLGGEFQSYMSLSSRGSWNTRFQLETQPMRYDTGALPCYRSSNMPMLKKILILASVKCINVNKFYFLCLI